MVGANLHVGTAHTYGAINLSEVRQRLSLQLRDAPLPLPKVRFALCWHERFQRDPGHRWMRERLFEAMRPLFEA